MMFDPMEPPEETDNTRELREPVTLEEILFIQERCSMELFSIEEFLGLKGRAA
jgi:hypothetical protein